MKSLCSFFSINSFLPLRHPVKSLLLIRPQLACECMWGLHFLKVCKRMRKHREDFVNKFSNQMLRRNPLPPNRMCLQHQQSYSKMPLKYLVHLYSALDNPFFVLLQAKPLQLHCNHPVIINKSCQLFTCLSSSNTSEQSQCATMVNWYALASKIS